MAEKDRTSPEKPSRNDRATVLRDNRPAGHIATGSSVGQYTIREVLGEGGFAVVYLADQTEPVRRRVALKVIKLGMDTKQVLARFEAERQALAMMDHPNVAKVLDAGMTEDGRSYFVMEHVPGVPITDHCDCQRLSIDERLALFMQVCRAVQHAHQKGIIHRDLKPSNILVAAKEGRATPKVIDFGVAKALHQKLTEKTLFTEQGQLIGTPEYMSPEQAEMTAQDIDTRSDIYSLGVLLYELLVGALPFESRRLRREAFGEIQRIIREEQPAKPSTRLSSLGDDSTTSATKRRLDSRSLLRELRGDLDWIVMKCLEKDRDRRYETANSLALDITRHLKNEPVLAGPPSATYRMSKFIRRNRGAVAAAGVIAAVLIAGVIVSTSFYLRAEQSAAEARREAGRAAAISEFLNEDVLEVVSLYEQGVQISIRELIDATAERLEDASRDGGRFVDKPLVEADLRKSIGDRYQELGDYVASERHYRRAVELFQHELGAEHTRALAAERSVSMSLRRQGLYDEAKRMLGVIIETQRRHAGRGRGGGLPIGVCPRACDEQFNSLCRGRAALSQRV